MYKLHYLYFQFQFFMTSLVTEKGQLKEASQMSCIILNIIQMQLYKSLLLCSF